MDDHKDGPLKVVDRRWWARQQDEETAAPSAPGAAADDAPRLKPTYVEELEQQLAERDRQLQDVLIKYRDASREFDDARARLRKEIAKDIERSRRTLLLELLDVVDNLDRAIEAGRATHHGDPAAGRRRHRARPVPREARAGSACRASTRSISRSIPCRTRR